MMDEIDSLLDERVVAPAGVQSGEAMVWNGTTWVRSSVTRIGVGSLGSGSPSASNFLRGDGTWATPAGGTALICTHTVSVAQASIDTNTVIGGVIPTTYKHLKVVIQGLCTHADTAINGGIRFNNDSGANYHNQRIYGSGATATADEAIGATYGRIGNFPGSTATVPLNCIEILIPNYNGTTFKKTYTSNAMHASDVTTGNLQTVQIGGAWNSAAAITRLAVYPVSGNLDVGTVFSLYGLL
jgi:hypothetical protein